MVARFGRDNFSGPGNLGKFFSTFTNGSFQRNSSFNQVFYIFLLLKSLLNSARCSEAETFFKFKSVIWLENRLELVPVAYFKYMSIVSRIFHLLDAMCDYVRCGRIPYSLDKNFCMNFSFLINKSTLSLNSMFLVFHFVFFRKK